MRAPLGTGEPRKPEDYMGKRRKPTNRNPFVETGKPIWETRATIWGTEKSTSETENPHIEENPENRNTENNMEQILETVTPGILEPPHWKPKNGNQIRKPSNISSVLLYFGSTNGQKPGMTFRESESRRLYFKTVGYEPKYLFP